MALHRGVQSAIFYYLSCAPCAEARYRRKRKEEARRDRVDKDHLETLMPNLYRHPSPSSTNPHWQADIGMGPSKPRGKKKPAGSTTESQNGGKAGTKKNSPNGSALPSSVDLPRIKSSSSENAQAQEDRLTTERSQRVDEELWGSAKSSMSAVSLRYQLNDSTNSFGLARPERARTRDSMSSYRSYRNPQVSDRHPSVVTKVESKEDVAWMLQPPPVATIMAGTESPPTRSGSNVSRPSYSRTSSVPMSRQASDRNDSLKVPALSRDGSARAGSSLGGQRHDRSTSSLAIEERDFAASPHRRDKHRPAPIHIAHPSDSSEQTIVHRPSQAPDPTPRKLSRPQLSTILSDSLIPSGRSSDLHTPAGTPRENTSTTHAGLDEPFTFRDRSERRSALVVKDSQLKALQDLSPRGGQVFNTQIFATTRDTKSGQQLAVPGSGRPEDRRWSGGNGLDGIVPDSALEMVDSWYTPDFELDKWVHEHTKRDGIRHRWSMDF
jgi:hypothetical protein